MTERVPVSERVPDVAGHGRKGRVPVSHPPLGGDTGHRPDRHTSARSELPPGVAEELANAIRQVNAAYTRLPADNRPDPASADPLEEEINRACLAGDRERALAAIRAWKGHWLHEFKGGSA